MSQLPLRVIGLESAPLPSRPLVLPWERLVADNHRLMPVGGRLCMTAKYRNGKQAIATLARIYWGGRVPIVGDVQLVATFWFPDARKRDAGNYRKALTDALTGIVYADDQQVADERYIRAGIDRENPRCEVSVRPLVARSEAA